METSLKVLTNDLEISQHKLNQANSDLSAQSEANIGVSKQQEEQIKFLEAELKESQGFFL
jgi:hypothetical protein